MHGIYRGGLGIHLAFLVMGADLGLRVDLANVPGEGALDDAVVLFSESAGRFLVTVKAEDQAAFENEMKDQVFACIGEVTAAADLIVAGRDGSELASLNVAAMRRSWKTPFGHLL